jgi:hypothetical protein
VLVLFFGSCGSKDEDLSLSNHSRLANSLIITKNHAPINQVKVFGFFGNRQVLLHEDSLESVNRFSLDISEFDFPAVYRVVLDDEVFDVIYNAESIHVDLTEESNFEGIHFLCSAENQHFYKFLKDYTYIQSADKSEICAKVGMLKGKYLQTNKDQFAHLIISFLLNSTYNCSKLPPNEFIERLELNYSLLKTPYITSQLETIVNSYAGETLESSELLELLLKQAGEKDAFNHFIRSIYWSLGTHKKDVDLIASLFQNEYIDSSAMQEMLFNTNIFEIGDQVDLEELGVQKRNNIDQHFILFSDAEHPKNDSLLMSISKVLEHEKNTTLTFINFSQLSTEIRMKYTLIISPILFQTSSNGYLIDQFFGLSSINRMDIE